MGIVILGKGKGKGKKGSAKDGYKPVSRGREKETRHTRKATKRKDTTESSSQDDTSDYTSEDAFTPGVQGNAPDDVDTALDLKQSKLSYKVLLKNLNDNESLLKQSLDALIAGKGSGSKKNFFAILNDRSALWIEYFFTTLIFKNELNNIFKHLHEFSSSQKFII